jgi:catechol 2,3-dioxygenase-like lactoylglutathione lyase family enzyme|tara:strand:- start:7936 stop:8373 length:438 start_codon:yes stop_codon:yes gene_type:complete
MSITLDHVGLLVRNIDETIEFYSRILGLNKTEKTVDNGLEFAKIQISDATAFAIWEVKEIHCQHVALALNGEEFDAVFQRLKNAGIRYGNATDGFGEDGNLYGDKLNMKGPDLEIGARGICKSLYFEDPNGHSIEILTYEDKIAV